MDAELIWKMAEAAHAAYYCPHRGRHGDCDDCRETGKCFELEGGFNRDDNCDWYVAAEAALEVFQQSAGRTDASESTAPA